MRNAGDLLQRYRLLRILLMLLVIITGIYACTLIWNTLTVFGDIILLFFLAWIISFILEPASTFLQSRGLPRPLAVTLIYLALLIVIFSAVVLTVPVIAQQVLLVTNEIAQLLSPSNVSNLNATLVAILERFGLSEQDARTVAAQFSQQLPAWAGDLEKNAIGTATVLVTSVVTILFNVLLVTIISFYIMLDGDRLAEGIVRRLPPAWIPDVRQFQNNVYRIFGGFFRAQLIIGAVYGVVTWIMLLLLGEPNGLLVAVFAGALMILPFIGPILAVVPPMILVILQAPLDQVAVKLIVLLFVLVIAQQFILQFLAPRIFGDSMGIHPLLLFAALLIGAKIGGAWGAFFAAPIVAVAYATLDVFYNRFASTSELFQRPAVTPSAAADERAEEGEEPVAEVVIPDPGASSHRNLRVPVGPGASFHRAPAAGSPNQAAPRPRPVEPRDSMDEALDALEQPAPESSRTPSGQR